MITDYIGGEGSAETPKNDYVIYGWPLKNMESNYFIATSAITSMLFKDIGCDQAMIGNRRDTLMLLIGIRMKEAKPAGRGRSFWTSGDSHCKEIERLRFLKRKQKMEPD